MNVLEALTKSGYEVNSIGSDVFPAALVFEGNPCGFILPDLSVSLIPEHEAKRTALDQVILHAINIQGLEEISGEAKLSQYENTILTVTYDFYENREIFHISALEDDGQMVLVDTCYEKSEATQKFAARSGLVGNMPTSAYQKNRIQRFMDSIRKRGYNLIASSQKDSFRTYDITDSDGNIVGYIGKNDLVTITSDDRRHNSNLRGAYQETGGDTPTLPAFFEKLKQLLKGIGMALKVSFTPSGRHYAIQDKHVQVATINDKQEITYTPQATETQMRKIDAVVKQAREEYKGEIGVDQEKNREAQYKSSLPDEAPQTGSASDLVQRKDEKNDRQSDPELTTSDIKALAVAVLSNEALSSQLNKELLGKIASFSQNQNSVSQDTFSPTPNQELLIQDFNEYIDLLKTLDGFNPEEKESLRQEIIAKFGTASLDEFMANMKSGKYDDMETIESRLEYSQKQAAVQNSGRDNPQREQGKEMVG
ncbi:hypothetical protein [Faecalispora jeddahensis]|uniref:hypothetical protein n=1 Tax=Faecalispora jeddahensis TaxID=1414721 RepID=UPI0004BB4079|nr:hypothetical protein [Faecalispora jeddahensis]